MPREDLNKVSEACNSLLASNRKFENAIFSDSDPVEEFLRHIEDIPAAFTSFTGQEVDPRLHYLLEKHGTSP